MHENETIILVYYPVSVGAKNGKRISIWGRFTRETEQASKQEPATQRSADWLASQIDLRRPPPSGYALLFKCNKREAASTKTNSVLTGDLDS